MIRVDDLHLRVLVLSADVARAREVWSAGVRTASGPEGFDLEPVHVDPTKPGAVADDDVLRMLHNGAGVLVDLERLPADVFRLLSFHARIRPRAVIFIRTGQKPLPFELHEIPVRALDLDTDDQRAHARREIARLMTLAASARDRAGAAEHGVTRAVPALRRAERRERSGAGPALRRVDRAWLAGDAVAARVAAGEARARAKGDPEPCLVEGLALREAGRWAEAERALLAATELDADWAPAWRELGVARDRGGLDGADVAYRRAVELDADYAAEVALASLLSRRGDRAGALVLLERALEGAQGQWNLVLPALVLRAGCTGRVSLIGHDRERLEHVLEVRRSQALAGPAQDAPWSAYDAATACLLLGRYEEADQLVRAARAHVTAPWQHETFARSLDSLECAAVPVARPRELLGLQARRARCAVAPAADGRKARPFAAQLLGAEAARANVPCASACPVGTDAGTYVALVAQGRFDDAYRAARGPNPFASVCGLVCAAPCESSCRRGRIDEPVSIRAIKHFLTVRHGPESEQSLLPDVLDGTPAPCMEGAAYTSRLRKQGRATTGRRVAVVGGGPSGLACAHDLALLGHRVTIFEASSQLGGMMRHGIPDYRLPRDVLDAEVAAILDLGVEVKLSSGLGSERTLETLLAQGFEAVFLGSGAGRGRGLDVEGSQLDGVVRAIDFLINVHGDYRMELGPRVLVMGGGNVAIDVARTARLGRPPDAAAARGGDDEDRFGPALPQGALRDAVKGAAREVHVVARGPLEDWPARRGVHGAEEVEAAVREGVVLHPLRGIRRILGEHGRVTAVELAEVVRLTDDSGRYAPMYGPHAAETIPCDSVLLAVGQEADLDEVVGRSGLLRTPDGFVKTDPVTLATSVPGVFAGGDAAFGPRTLIEAVAEGKRAASGIHAHLGGGRPVAEDHTFVEIHPRDARLCADFDAIPREEPPVVAVERRTGLAYVDGVYDEETARRQASRCLSCHVQTVYDGSLCIACGRCTDVCPHACLTLASPRDVDASGLAEGAVLGDGGEGSVLMLKDEDHCVRCGLCAERCPTGAMTMERYELAARAT